MNCSISLSKDGAAGTFGKKKLLLIFKHFSILVEFEPHTTLTDFLDQSQYNLIVKTSGSCGENQLGVDVNLQNREVREEYVKNNFSFEKYPQSNTVLIYQDSAGSIVSLVSEESDQIKKDNTDPMPFVR